MDSVLPKVILSYYKPDVIFYAHRAVVEKVKSLNDKIESRTPEVFETKYHIGEVPLEIIRY